MGMDRWVSLSDAERFEPAMIPVTAGKKRPTNPLKKIITVGLEYRWLVASVYS